MATALPAATIASTSAPAPSKQSTSSERGTPVTTAREMSAASVLASRTPCLGLYRKRGGAPGAEDNSMCSESRSASSSRALAAAPTSMPVAPWISSREASEWRGRSYRGAGWDDGAMGGRGRRRMARAPHLEERLDLIKCVGHGKRRTVILPHAHACGRSLRRRQRCAACRGTVGAGDNGLGVRRLAHGRRGGASGALGSLGLELLSMPVLRLPHARVLRLEGVRAHRRQAPPLFDLFT